METTQPNPAWDESAHEETVSTLREAGDDLTIHVWGADWCGDCRAVLPDFFAALDAAGLADDAQVHEVDRRKRGDLVDEYDVSLIATIVAEKDGEEVARFEESAPVSAAESIAEQLRESYVSAE